MNYYSSAILRKGKRNELKKMAYLNKTASKPHPKTSENPANAVFTGFLLVRSTGSNSFTYRCHGSPSFPSLIIIYTNSGMCKTRNCMCGIHIGLTRAFLLRKIRKKEKGGSAMQEKNDGINRQLFRAHMVLRGINTNIECARICGLSVNTVSNFFRGVTPTIETVQAFVHGLELSDSDAADIFLKLTQHEGYRQERTTN